MAWFRWRRGAAPPQTPEGPGAAPPSDEDDDDLSEEGHLDGVDVDLAVEQVQQLAQMSEPPDPPLLQARLADLLRDEEVDPWPPERFAAWSADFGELAWRQLSISVELLARMGLGRKGGTAPDAVYGALATQVSDSAEVGLELLATSEVRAEEFARRLAWGMGWPIEGEDEDESRQELEKLDYRLLLAMANNARLSAEERMARLHMLQKSQDNARRRGKW